MRIAVVGSGLVGSALASALGRRGDRVTVLSPSPSEISGLWRHCEAVSGDGLREGIQDCDLVVYAAWSTAGKRTWELARMGPEHACVAAKEAQVPRFLMLGPTGANPEGRGEAGRGLCEAFEVCRKWEMRVQFVGLPVLFGEGDHLMAPWMEPLARGRRPRIQGPKCWVQPLWISDAIKLLLKFVDGEVRRPRVQVLGPERWRMMELGKLVCDTFSGRPAMFSSALSPVEIALLEDQQTAIDNWEELDLWKRTRVKEWLAGRQL